MVLTGPHIGFEIFLRRSLLPKLPFDPGTLSVPKPGGEGKAGVLVTDISGSRRFFKLHPGAVLVRGAGRAGVDVVPLSEETQDCTSANTMVQCLVPEDIGRGTQAGSPDWDTPCLHLWDL